MTTMNFFKSFESTTSPRVRECGRCLFDACGRKEWCRLVSCVICGRGKLFAKMVKCDACHRFAHRRCISGALRTDQRCSDSVARARATTAEVACGEDRPEVCVDAGTQTTVVTTTDVASGDETVRVDGGSQTSVTACDVASGDETVRVDGDSQTSVTTCDVASGDEIVRVDGGSQTSITACDVASGDETVRVDGGSQTSVTTCDVASGEETVRVDGGCQTSVTACDVASGDETVRVDGCSQNQNDSLPSIAPPAIVATLSQTGSTSTVAAPSGSNANTYELTRTFKYWKLRYSLFSKFDHGIMLDEDSMFSVCPEVLAQHMAKRCSVGTVLDPFCGAGGNAIQLAFTCAHVIAIDFDPRKIMLARRNAEIYGVADRIDFRVGDSYQVAADLRVDAVVTSPPWGGPGYRRGYRFDARHLGSRETGGMSTILKMVHAVAPNAILHVPKNMDRAQCLQMAATAGFGRVQYEFVTIDRKPNCLNLYLTRKDTHAPGFPVQTYKDAHLNTQPSFGMQNMHRERNDNIRSYTSYIKSVTQFLAA